MSGQVMQRSGPTAGGGPGARRRVRRWIALGVAMVLAGSAAAFLALGGLDDPREAPAVVGATEVGIRDDAFTPPVIRIERGATVTWTFADGDEEHNVVGEGWGSARPQTTGTVDHTFSRVGTFDYACTLHRGMRGRVQVVDALVRS